MLTDGTRVVIRSGAATPEQLAALLVALDTATARTAPAVDTTPPWRAAALREAATHPRISSRSELVGRSWGGWL